MTKNFKLEDLSSYEIATRLASLVYSEVKNWNLLDQRTTGTQFIRCTDSIAANIAEGFGRYHKKDKIKFFYNARASVFEAAHWARTAISRKLLDKEQGNQIMSLLRKLPKEINSLIKYTNINLTI